MCLHCNCMETAPFRRSDIAAGAGSRLHRVVAGMIGDPAAPTVPRELRGGTGPDDELDWEGLRLRLAKILEPPNSLQAVSRSKTGSVVAIGKTQEPGRNPVDPGQSITPQPHPGESGHAIKTIIARAACPVPHRHGDIDLLKLLQGRADAAAVGNTGRALQPVSDGDHMIVRGLRIDVSLAVSRGRQALHQGGNTGAARPGDPAEVSRLNTVVDVADDSSHRHICQALLMQCNRVKMA